MNNDELKGKMDQAKGRVKQATGDLTGDERLRQEGLDDEAVGKVQDVAGRTRRKVGETLDDIADDIKR